MNIIKQALRTLIKNTSVAVDDTQALRTSTKAKLADYTPKGVKASYGLPTASVGYCFASNEQLLTLHN
jgi:hypothetical protein